MMQSLESFVAEVVKQGRDDIKDFEECKKILAILAVKKEPICLKYEFDTNT